MTRVLNNSYREQIIRVKDNDDRIPFILVGNKSDLEERRKVPRTIGEKRAKTWNTPFIETSAKTRHNVDKAFFDLLRLIRDDKRRRQGKSQQKGEGRSFVPRLSVGGNKSSTGNNGAREDKDSTPARPMTRKSGWLSCCRIW